MRSENGRMKITESSEPHAPRPSRSMMAMCSAMGRPSALDCSRISVCPCSDCCTLYCRGRRGVSHRPPHLRRALHSRELTHPHNVLGRRCRHETPKVQHTHRLVVHGASCKTRVYHRVGRRLRLKKVLRCRQHKHLTHLLCCCRATCKDSAAAGRRGLPSSRSRQSFQPRARPGGLAAAAWFACRVGPV